jgi:hypothetical protein
MITITRETLGKATIGRVGGEIAPWVAAALATGGTALGAALGGARAGAGLLGNAAAGAAGGAIIGGSQFVPEGGSREGNAAIGGLLGGIGSSVVPAVAKGVGSVAGGILNWGKNAIGYMPESTVASKVLGGITPESLEGVGTQEANQSVQDTLNNFAAGKRLGLQLTPGEASANPILGLKQGVLGQSDQTASKLLAFGKGQEQAQQDAIDNFLTKISPNSENPAIAARTTAGQAIKDEQQALQAKAAPYYTAAEPQAIPANVHLKLMEDPIIADTLSQVRNDPILKHQIAGFADNQIAPLDAVKKELDTQIGKFMNFGDNNRASILAQSRQKLVDAMDSVSPEYQTARGIYEQGMPNLKSLTTGDVGRIANLSDSGLQNLSKIIFDPAETDINSLIKIRDTISAQNPDLWRQIVRNSMESSMEASRQAATGKAGSAFFNGMMSTDRKYNQFMTALEGIPGAQETFSDMRLAFQNLINTRSVKGAAGMAENHMNMPRSTGEFAMSAIKAMTGGNFDKAAVDMITSDKWLPYLREVKQIQNPVARGVGYANLLSRVAAQQATSP